MDDFSTLARDYGFRPQGKAAPMKAGIGSGSGDRRPWSSATTSSPLFDDKKTDGLLFNDVFGGPPKYSRTNSNSKPSSASDFDYDPILSSSSSGPVYDKPVYDDDIFDGLPGLKSKPMSSSAAYDEDVNVFASMPSPSKKSDNFDDLLGNFGRAEKMEDKYNKSQRSFDDLLPGFGSGSPSASNRPSSVSQPTKSTGNSNQTASSTVMDDPFVVLGSTSTPGVPSSGVFTDPLDDLDKFSTSVNTKTDASSVSGGIFDDMDPLTSFAPSTKEQTPKSSSKYSESKAQKKAPIDDLHDSHQPIFDMPTVSTDSHKSNVNSFDEAKSQVDPSPKSEEQVQQPDDIWLTVAEIPLFTPPTQAPPPSRPPPPIPAPSSRSNRGSFATRNTRHNEFSQSPRTFRPTPTRPMVSQVDELEDFGRGGTRNSANADADIHSGAAAMKEATDRAEGKFRHAKEVRGSVSVKSTRSKEMDKDDDDDEEEEETRERRRWEEEERERKRLEKERERAREIERERARQAVERATREARDRAAMEARRRAERAAVQRAQNEARERAAAEARERAERVAVEARERAAAEARERAAAEARDRANAEARERASAEAREKEARDKAEARRRAERAAVERAAAEARERAASEARERAAAAARMNQPKNDDDLESFFSMNSRPSSAARPRASSSDPVPDPQFQSRGGPGDASRTSSGASSNMKKASSTTNIFDDLTSILGTGASSAGEFQDIEGETEERRRARLERHQRTQERAAKALAEKNQRDLQTQREQEERHRIAETLDFEIKRWAAGKEGNLRALLSTLQYVLWPECGWQPVSLTDLITGASVKKAYRKATLCIHPDKVQQKGANLQQKYIAEKVFDLLKEAWNKFNSEELF